jgi:hypothetical protein
MFLHHEKRCVVCGEDRIVTVHHFDENHFNNDPSNLVPVCPTHHQYLHSQYRCLVETRINEYHADHLEELVEEAAYRQDEESLYNELIEGL